ncbi:MAG: 30S ribosomal protein S12 methylthiotransferase RimO [Bacilli bacterium]|nr:30S ribosomal protein S12 methylthiotransferase RimO [Bacilli bacterium]
MNKKVCLISLGCSKNLVDSEHILGLLKEDGYQITNNEKECDILVINTCGFIDSSKKESINTILSKINKPYKLVVTGCLIERYLDELKKEIPEVDLYIPIRDYYRFNELLSSLDDDIKDNKELTSSKRVITTGSFSSYLRIGDGCDNRCAYCAIPLIRGPYKSRPLDEIISEAHYLKELGIKEIVVLEQDTTKYGSDLEGDIDIVTLLKELLKIEEFEYIRLLYLYPDEISDGLIDLIACEKRLTPYFDIPIQHSESSILKRMNRRGDKQYLYNLFKKIRTKIPNAILRTTILVGFPGESEEDISNLLEFIEEIQFDHLGVFTYSKEEGTASYNFTNQVEEEIKQERKDKVMKLQQKISYRRNKNHIGEIMEGLIVKKESNYYLFRSYWNAPDDVDGNIYVKADMALEIGQKVKVKITNAYVYDLLGRVLEN